MDPQGSTVDEECPGPTSVFHPDEYVSLPAATHGGNFGSNMEAWINEVRINVNLAQRMDHPKGPCTIFKVPEHIRQLDPKAYEPVIAFLGPFHHNSCESSFMKVHKWQCVRYLLSHQGSREHAGQLLNQCLLELEKQNERVRSCYSEVFSNLNGQDMALIMLLDGCFIIYLMVTMCPGMESLFKKEREEREVGKLDGEATQEVVLNIGEKDEQLEGPTVAGLFTQSLVVYDLLKLENQIPFFIIQLLFDHLKVCEDVHINLVDLALQLFEGIHPEESKSDKKKSKKKCPEDCYDLIQRKECYHLLHLFYSSRMPSRGSSRRTSTTSVPKWIPSATELNRAGVKFKRKEHADSFLNIKFGRRKMKLTPLLCLRKLFLLFRSGRMKIPPLQIYDYTGPLFRNLIAFEQCYFDPEMYFTIYTLFMDCIIDQAEDVRLLHLEGILQHKLSNDQEVADLFNKLGSQIHYVPEENYLAKQIEKVNRFYEVKWHKWLAALRRDYLGNPWTTISVLAAAFLLLLTVEQAVFSALSYLHPLHQG